MKCVPFKKGIIHSIGKNPDGSWCWQMDHWSAEEMFYAFDLPDGTTDLEDFIVSRTWDGTLDGERIYDRDQFNGCAIVRDEVVEMIEKPGIPPGNDTVHDIVCDFMVAFCVAHAERIVLL